ncbi:MAG: ATP cone domain-containing protein [archaeon]
MVKIVKMNGAVDDFNKQKIVRSCVRAGASMEVCSRIADYVEGKVYEGISSKDILSMIHEQLKVSGNKDAAVRYKLKDAISKLDPEIHEFEFFIMRLLRYDGYDTERSPEPKVQGLCVDHEIDVVARRRKETVIIECKHHYRDHTFTGLDVPMRQWARLDDIVGGYKQGTRNSINATSAWVVTNTNYSEHAVRYSKCKHVQLLAWNYPYGHGLNEMIENYRAYPLTLIGLTRNERERLVQNNIFNVLDLLDADEFLLKRIGFDVSRARRLKSLIERLINPSAK